MKDVGSRDRLVHRYFTDLRHIDAIDQLLCLVITNDGNLMVDQWPERDRCHSVTLNEAKAVPRQDQVQQLLLYERHPIRFIVRLLQQLRDGVLRINLSTCRLHLYETQRKRTHAFCDNSRARKHRGVLNTVD
jgi:hypothetical protein